MIIAGAQLALSYDCPKGRSQLRASAVWEAPFRNIYRVIKSELFARHVVLFVVVVKMSNIAVEVVMSCC